MMLLVIFRSWIIYWSSLFWPFLLINNPHSAQDQVPLSVMPLRFHLCNPCSLFSSAPHSCWPSLQRVGLQPKLWHSLSLANCCSFWCLEVQDHSLLYCYV